MLARQVLGHQFAGETRRAVQHDLKLPICHGLSTTLKIVEKGSKFGRHSGAQRLVLLCTSGLPTKVLQIKCDLSPWSGGASRATMRNFEITRYGRWL